MEVQNINLQKFTVLPMQVVSVQEKMLPDVMIHTPHKGVVYLKLKKEHYPFIFGSVTQTEKHLQEVIFEIVQIEEDAAQFLLKEWSDKLRGKSV